MRPTLKTLALLSLIFASVFSGEARAQPRDNKDYCRGGGRLVLLLIDITTPYDQTDKNAIVQMTDRVLTSIEGGDRLIVRTIADSHTRSERLAERCIPHCPASSMWKRMLNCSDGVIRTDFEAVRAEVIAAMRNRLATFHELPYSDIVRTISSVLQEERRDIGELSLYVYSDLIENSDYFPSKYLFSYNLQRLIFGLHHYKLIPDLKGARVQVAGFGRAGTSDRRPLKVDEINKLREFWTGFFKEAGAASISISQNPI
jgi:hypothetical protein